jgi:hypothetical protein
MSLNHITNPDGDQLDLYAKSYNTRTRAYYSSLVPLIFQGTFPVGFVTSIYGTKLTRDIYSRWEENAVVPNYKKFMKLTGSCSVQVDLAPFAQSAGFTIEITGIPAEFQNSVLEYGAATLRTKEGSAGTAMGLWTVTTSSLGFLGFSITNDTHIDVALGEQKLYFELEFRAA